MGPNTFIVGGAKCGTTAMHSSLEAHPDVFMSPVKEPGFFAPDLPWQPAGRAVLDPTAYRALFDGAEGSSVRGEASVAYLRSELAASAIRTAHPDARVIVMLRNPFDVVRSLHAFVRYLGIQPEADLGRALAAAPSDERWLLDYRSVVDFAPQLDRYLATFPTAQVHVVVHDDLVADPAAVWRAVLEFLQLDPTAVGAMRRENVTRRARIPALNERLMSPPKGAATAARLLLPAGLRRRVRRTTLALNSEVARREPLDAVLGESLRHDLAPGITRLGALLGRDLNRWLESPV